MGGEHEVIGAPIKVTSVVGRRFRGFALFCESVLDPAVLPLILPQAEMEAAKPWHGSLHCYS